MLARFILLKKGIRRDALWTHPRIYKSHLKLIPLFLDTWALTKSQYWPREQLDALQNERLALLLKDAVRVPFWKEILDRVHFDPAKAPKQMLSEVPVTAKKALAGHPLAYIADRTLLARSDPDNTSGSTGKPFHFFQDWCASLRSFAITERIFRTTGKRYPVVYMRARSRNGFTFHRHIWFFLRGFNSVPYRMNDFKEFGKRLKKGFILYGYTSWVLELARQMEKLGIELPIRAAMVAGEHLTKSDRMYIEKVMNVELFTLYASREVGFLGFECKHHNMHISEEWAYVEIVDEKGQLLPPGKEGRIIVTTFDNRVMPFIRYEIGDIGVISDDPCPCGRTLRTLTFKGRTSELIELEDNRTVSLLDVSYTLGSHRDCVRQYQIIQTSKISFVIVVVPGPQYDEKKEYLEALLVRMFHPRVQLTWKVTTLIPEAESGKAVYFIRDFQHP